MTSLAIEIIDQVRILTTCLDQTIHTNPGRQGLQTTATIPLVQAIGPTALEALVARGVQVDHRLGHLVVVEDKINDQYLDYENAFTSIFYCFFELLYIVCSKLRSGSCHQSGKYQR